MYGPEPKQVREAVMATVTAHPRYPKAAWDVRKATPEQIRAARFLALRLQTMFNPRQHESVWDMDSRTLQEAWCALAQTDYPLYCKTHKTACEVQAVATAMLKGEIPLDGEGLS